MFYLGNFLILLSSSIAVELMQASFINNSNFPSIGALLTCLVMALFGIVLAFRMLKEHHVKTTMGRSLGIAMIVTALISGIVEESSAFLPSTILFLGYLIPGILISIYNCGAKHLTFEELSSHIKKVFGSLLEYARDIKRTHEMAVARKYECDYLLDEDPVLIDEVILNLNFAHRIFADQEQTSLKENLKKCELYLLEFKNCRSLSLEQYNYLFEEIDSLASAYIDIMSQYIHVDESKKILKYLDDAFEMITLALGNIYEDYMEAKAFEIEVNVRALKLHLSEEGLLQSRFSDFE